MPAYLVLKITVTNPERWTAYRDAVVPLIEGFGGKRATKPGGSRLLEGEGAATISIYEFSGADAIEAFWNSREYGSIRELRRDAAILEAWMVPGS